MKLFTFIRIWINSHLNPILDEIESSEKYIGKIINNLESNLSEAKKAVVQSITDFKKMERKSEDNKKYNKQKQVVESLKRTVKQLSDEITYLKQEKNILKARKSCATLKKNLLNTLSGLSDKSQYSIFEKLTEEIENIEIETEAFKELKED